MTTILSLAVVVLTQIPQHSGHPLRKGGGEMTFQQAIPIIEGHLYSWGVRKMEHPDAPISKVYDGASTPPAKSGRHPISQPEAWVIRRQHAVWKAAVIDRVLRGMNKELQRLVELRYVKRCSWRNIAETLNMGDRTVFRLRDSVLLVMAYEFGLLKEQGEVEQTRVCH